jgi:transcriptional regulator of acetoin/glycerol metabolism
METEYYKLLNFVTRLSQPKLKIVALENMSKLTEKNGNTAIDIFEHGIDNAESIIAIEARKLLIGLKTANEEPKQVATWSEEKVMRDAFIAAGGNVSKMIEATKIPQRTIYKKIKKYNLTKESRN